ncbi:MAG TPA: hypothetical protein VFA10_14200 [Ktedonobacteraceae bacterium]|nr:hypothetical protein [Ktedonobacteraceae bacterium]
MTQIVSIVTPTVNCIGEDDLMQHIEDTHLFWVFRNGKSLRLTWNELTSTEQQYQQEAAARAAYIELFEIY